MKIKLLGITLSIAQLFCLQAQSQALNSCNEMAVQAVKAMRNLTPGRTEVASAQVILNREQSPTNGADLIVLVNGTEKYYVLASNSNGSTGCDQVHLVVEATYKNYFRQTLF